MTDPKPNPRPPGDRGQGRKALPPDEFRRVVAIRLSEPERTKYEALGGAQWVRAQIKKAKLPKEPKG
jgi:hypothetical protein